MRRRVVAVIGGSEPDAAERTLAFRMGALVAREGFALATGGLGGVMEEASRGAREAGGLVIGIVPHADPEACNLHVEISIATGLGEARNAVIACTADALVAIGGGLGTLSEIALALKRGKPVLGLSTWALDASRLPPGAPWRVVASPEEAVDALRETLGARG
jgi:uncharacterized protein (TIGR00725 family)